MNFVLFAAGHSLKEGETPEEFIDRIIRNWNLACGAMEVFPTSQKIEPEPDEPSKA